MEILWFGFSLQGQGEQVWQRAAWEGRPKSAATGAACALIGLDGCPGHLCLLHNFARASFIWLREEQKREHLPYARHCSKDHTYKLTNLIFRTLRNRYYHYLRFYWLKTGTETEKLSDLPKVTKLTQVAEAGFESRHCGTQVCTMYIM